MSPERNAEIRSFLLGRFSKLKSATTRGGLTPSLLRGKSGDKWPWVEVDAVLTEMRRDGTLTFTGGLWWRRG